MKKTTLYLPGEKVRLLKEAIGCKKTQDFEKALLETDKDIQDPVFWVGNNPTRVHITRDGALQLRLQALQAQLQKDVEGYLSLSAIARRLLHSALARCQKNA